MFFASKIHSSATAFLALLLFLFLNLIAIAQNCSGQNCSKWDGPVTPFQCKVPLTRKTAAILKRCRPLEFQAGKKLLSSVLPQRHLLYC